MYFKVVWGTSKLFGIFFMDDIPIYQHIKEILLEEIRQGKYRPGDRLPSSNELAKLFSVSRNTTVKALEELVREGAGTPVRGRGTIVNDLAPGAAPVFRSVRNACPDVGLLLADLDDLNHPYITRILAGISERAKTLSCSLRIFCIRNTAIRDFVAQRHFDGLIVITELPAASILYMKQRNVPFVLLGNDLPGEPVAAVSGDSFSATGEAMRMAARLGHRRIGVLGGPTCKAVTTGAYLAYRQVLAELDLHAGDCFFAACDWGEKSGYQVFRRLWMEGKRPTALIAAEDYMAYGALRAASEFGLRVPETLSVIGAGNYPVPEGRIPLTTFDLGLEERGRRSLALLLDILNGKAPDDTRIYLHPRLIERGSCVENTRKKTKGRKDAGKKI